MVSFVMAMAILAFSLGPCVAQTTPRALDNNSDISHKQPNPHSDSAGGASSGLRYDEDSTAENELLEAANKSRELAGAAPLRMEPSLREAARAHARRMVASGLLEHQLAGEPSLMERIALVSTPADGSSRDGLSQDALKQDALKVDRAGENIANATCAPGANDALMRSEPHRRNLLDRGFNVAGVAAIWSKGRLYVVEDFAREVPSYSARESRELVGRAVAEIRQEAGLPSLAQLAPPHLDEAACSLAKEDRPNARLLETAYGSESAGRKIIAYTESHPGVLPAGALRLLRDPGVRQFAVGSCYARNAAYPTGMYWIAILLY
jgi:uncharacterized protein YkwD